MEDETRDIYNEEIIDQPMVRPMDANLDEAIERVYRKYGSNLSLFFKDVQEELSLKRQDARDSRQHGSNHDPR